MAMGNNQIAIGGFVATTVAYALFRRITQSTLGRLTVLALGTLVSEHTCATVHHADQWIREGIRWWAFLQGARTPEPHGLSVQIAAIGVAVTITYVVGAILETFTRYALLVAVPLTVYGVWRNLPISR